ncbi:hypothetical protein E1293_16305 [Actinomadura darangshiensis]|uniref:Uncharacterized protein n=1 Tax=Actinomadura darangshiensis TaxID=705336 RepID=A0A4R5BCY7_9ACTN|nr:hypothetical protein [Actinomadura darangshiensis]TDD82596.1 hypothetical protein E1293_16305 [Actinomadura darangshiensis]
MTTTPQTGGTSALDELRAAYHDQLNRLAAERDAARRQARRAQAQADVARADLASLKSRVHELLDAAARHLPDLPALEGPALERATPELPPARETRALPAASRAPGTASETGKKREHSARAA